MYVYIFLNYIKEMFYNTIINNNNLNKLNCYGFDFIYLNSTEKLILNNFLLDN